MSTIGKYIGWAMSTILMAAGVKLAEEIVHLSVQKWTKYQAELKMINNLDTALIKLKIDSSIKNKVAIPLDFGDQHSFQEALNKPYKNEFMNPTVIISDTPQKLEEMEIKPTVLTPLKSRISNYVIQKKKKRLSPLKKLFRNFSKVSSHPYDIIPIIPEYNHRCSFFIFR
jgi:hypothetical protein